MEQHFCEIMTNLEDAKVNTATMYLIDEAKLWSRTKYDEI